MKKNSKISNAVIRRLPRYKRRLGELRRKGATRISSKEFSELLGYTASQIRQDLNNFGGFGQQGYGYNVKELHEQISKILGITKEYRLVIVGSNHMGQAIANYSYYREAGFVIAGIFDINPSLIGLDIQGVTVKHFSELDQFLSEHPIDIGVICTNKESAQPVAEKLERGGVKGIWNFAAIDLALGEGIQVENVHLSDSLHTLVYYMNNDGKEGSE